MQLITIPTISKEWVKRFLKRYPSLITIHSQTIDLARWQDTTPEVINAWFDAFEDTLKSYYFNNHNIYNINKTGFAIGSSQSNRVIVNTTLRTRYKVQPGRQK